MSVNSIEILESELYNETGIKTTCLFFPYQIDELQEKYLTLQEKIEFVQQQLEIQEAHLDTTNARVNTLELYNRHAAQRTPAGSGTKRKHH